MIFDTFIALIADNDENVRRCARKSFLETAKNNSNYVITILIEKLINDEKIAQKDIYCSYLDILNEIITTFSPELLKSSSKIPLTLVQLVIEVFKH